MWRKSVRRLVVIVLSAALATALVARSVQAGSMDMNAAAATAAMDMPMHGKCDGCAGHEKSTASAACSAYCGTIIALPYLVVTYYPIPAEAMGPRIALAATGLAPAPDPYPPKRAGIS